MVLGKALARSRDIRVAIFLVSHALWIVLTTTLIASIVELPLAANWLLGRSWYFSLSRDNLLAIKASRSFPRLDRSAIGLQLFGLVKSRLSPPFFRAIVIDSLKTFRK